MSNEQNANQAFSDHIRSMIGNDESIITAREYNDNEMLFGDFFRSLLSE